MLDNDGYRALSAANPVGPLRGMSGRDLAAFRGTHLAAFRGTRLGTVIDGVQPE